MLEITLYIILCLYALRNESEDWMRIEAYKNEALKNNISVQEMTTQVERVRRVTWRSGVIGSSVLATMLYFTISTSS